MSHATDQHPSREQLALFAHGRLPDAELAGVADHVSTCDECCKTLQHPPADTLVNLAREATTKDAAADIPPQLIDHPRYRVLSLLGAGGMGMVYRAEHRMMGREVALKVMSPRLLANAPAVERFRREVRAAAKLNHPNIVTAHDADEANGLHFLVMEYVDGQSLDRYVARKGPLPVNVACHVIRQAALGLSHAHQHGMIHRDIKPQNVMITRKGQIKVLDFGLARFARQEDDAAGHDQPPLMTAASMLMGTPDYLSPEQARSAPDIDARSDVYSLGCTFYFLLTGRVPFPKAATVMDKLLAHTREPAQPARAIRPEIPEEIEAIVRKMMAKTPAARYAGAADVAADLSPLMKNAEPTVPLPELPPAPEIEADRSAETAVLADTPPEPPRPDKKWRKKNRRRGIPLPVMAVGAGVLSLLLVTGIYFAVRPPRTTSTGDTKSTTAATTPTRTAGTPASAGKRVLFVLPPTGVWNEDYQPVRARLEALGCTVTTTSTERVARQAQHPANSGPDVTVDVLYDAVAPEDYDAVAVGGFNVAPLGIEHEATTRRIIDAFVGAGKPVSAICGGQQLLAKLGYLNGKSVAFSEMSKTLYTSRITARRDRVVTDGRVVTGAAGADARLFADELVKAMTAK